MKKYLLLSVKCLIALLFCYLSYRAWTLRPRVTLKPVISSSFLDNPLHITRFAGDPNRLVVTEKTGRIKVIDIKNQKVETILDLSAKTYLGHLEAGMLSTAFDPQFEKNHYMYVFYSIDNPVRAHVGRFTVGADGKADPTSEITILEWEKAEPHHYGGCLEFGQDGYLYISAGEDLPEADPRSAKLRGGNLRGAILRLDISQSTAQKPYAIPVDNPFVGKAGFAPELWAYGFRNPWRFHWDKNFNAFVVGDTGENSREEHNLLVKGGDYGWPEWEGELCHLKPCEKDKEIDPLASFSHAVARTAIAGFLYEGDRIPALKGKYFFADFVRGLFAINPKDIHNPITSPFSNKLEVLYYKMPIRQGPHKGDKHGIASIDNFGDDIYYIVDLNSTVYTLENVTFEDTVFGFFYQFLKF